MTEQEIDENLDKINEETTQLDVNAQPWFQVFNFFKEVMRYFNKTFIEPFKKDINLNTAADFALEEQAAHWVGLQRKLAVKAQGKAYVTISRNLNVPQDLILSSSAGTQFRVTEAVYLEQEKGGGFVPIEALVAGFTSNLGAGTMLTSQRALNGLESVTLLEGWLDVVGEEEEDDESLRGRIRSALVNQAGGDIQAKYISRAKEVKNVRDAVVWPIPRGAGSADLVIAAQDGIVTQAMLNEILAYLGNWGLINWDISVIAARKQVLNVAVSINNPNLSEEKVQEIIGQYTLSLKIADVFRLKDLYALLNYDVNIVFPVKDQTADQYSEWEVDLSFVDSEEAGKKW